MNSLDKTKTSSSESSGFIASVPTIPAMLVAHAPRGSVEMDRCLVAASFTVGRDPSANLSIRDDKVSKRHFRIGRDEEGFFIEDLGSTNGTFVDGLRIGPKDRQPLTGPAVIRVGRALLVFHEDAKSLLDPPLSNSFGMAGGFHTGALLKELEQASISGRHVLLAGPSGTGKELSANALAHMMGAQKKPIRLLAHNAARFTSEEEAASTLFGVNSKVFSNVDQRQGLIEQARGGALFLDEVHNLPQRVQRSLLRVMEDGLYSRIGDSEQKKADVRFIFASNAPGPDYNLAHDILARLRVTVIPPLCQRAADIPTIFNSVLSGRLKKHDIPEQRVFSRLSGDHYEALLLDGLPADNVRGLVDLADRLATRIAFGIEPGEAVSLVFSERFADGPVAARYSRPSSAPASGNSFYEQNKELIVAAYDECGGNVKRTVDLLNSRGVRCSRRWLAVFADKWGLRKKKS